MSAAEELKMAVVDDLEQDRDKIVTMTNSILCSAQIPHRIFCFSDGKALLDAINGGERYHVLLLDVMMDGMGGMELAEELRRQENHTSIIFISSNREMALCGYKVSAVRYLAKPLDEETLKEALLYVCRRRQEKKEILLPTSQGWRRTAFAEIQFVEAYERGTRFVLVDEIVETKLKFSDVETMLPKTMFVLCHRAYIVNIALTRRIVPYEFFMKSGAAVPISKHRYKEVNRQFVSYLTD